MLCNAPILSLLKFVAKINPVTVSFQAKSPIYEYLYKHLGTIGFMDLMNMKPWKGTVKVSIKKRKAIEKA